jgi:hypothetical protein
MFGYDNKHVVVAHIGDPTKDMDILIYRAPVACEIKAGYVVDNVGIAAGTENYFEVALKNAGTSGTATTAMAAAIGGTPASGTAPAWTVNVPQAFTISEGTMAAGEWVKLDYDETGTVAQNITVVLEVLYGIAA